MAGQPLSFPQLVGEVVRAESARISLDARTR